MSNYSKTTDFEAKDSLPTGDSGKIIRGAEFETEFDAISTAIATKADTAGPTFTGTLTFETISDGTIGVTAFVDEDDMSSDSATLVPTQQSVKAYVDSQVTAQDLDFQADSGGALSIDLDSETMTFTGGTGIDTSGSGNAVTFAIDSTVATLTGTQTLTNKTLTSPDVNTPDIDGGTIDGTVIGGATPAAVSATTVSATGNITVGGTVDGRDVATDGTKLDGIESGATADQTAAEIRTLVESATDSNVFTDADHTKLDGIEANATADQTDAEIRAAVEAATDSNVFTDADHSKLDGIEAGADVTDTTNVTAAGAVMDSELTSEASVKALNQGVATTDSPTFAAVTVNGNVEFDGLSGTGAVTVTDILDQDDMSSDSATALATQQSIKAYVDSQVATADTLAEVLANGNTTGGTDVAFGDNDKAIFGAGSDLQIYHNANNSFIQDAGTGSLYIDGSASVNIRETSTNAPMAVFTGSGSADLYHNGIKKLATTATGIDVTGTAVTDGLTVAGTAQFDNYGGTTGKGRIQFGNSGQQFIEGLDTGNGGSGAYLRFGYGSTDVMTVTSTGIDVTGTVTADGLTVSGSVAAGPVVATISNSGANGAAQLYLNNDAQNWIVNTRVDDAFSIYNATSNKTPFLINTNGDISFYEDTGTTAKLFWDASAESLGIGNTSPTRDLTVGDTAASSYINIKSSVTNGISGLAFGDSGDDNRAQIVFDNSTDKLQIQNGGGGALGNRGITLDSSENVGIGTSSPASDSGYAGLTLSGSTGSQVVLQDDGTTEGLIWTNNALNVEAKSTNPMVFRTNSAERMRIDSSGNVGIGTDSPDTLLHLEGADGVPQLKFLRAGTVIGGIIRQTSSPYGLTYDAIDGNAGDPTHVFRTSVDGSTFTERMRIDSSGNVGIGTSSPRAVSGYNSLALDGSTSGLLDINTNGTRVLSVYGASNDINLVNPTSTGAMRLYTNDTERMRIDSSGNVDLYQGNNLTWRYAAGSTIRGSMSIDSADNITFSNTSSNTERMRIGSTGIIYVNGDGIGGRISGDGSGALVLQDGNGRQSFKILSPVSGSAQAMTLDASGNLLVGTTSESTWESAAGFRARQSGSTTITRDGNPPLYVNRLSSDGTLLQFQKGTAVVGSIGVEGGDLTIGTDTQTGLHFWNNAAIRPWNITANTRADAVCDLGESNTRFKDLYLSGGVRASTLKFENLAGTTEYARFDGSGSLLVGLTSSNYLAADDGIQLNANGTARFGGSGTSARNLLSFVNGTDGTPAEVGFIQTNGSATSYSTSSDQRLKDNIVDAPSASDDIDAIQVRSFDWKADGSHQKYGMVAQELQSVAPEAVSGDANSDEMMGVDYSKLVPMMLKEIQSLRARVAQLEGEN